ncbi:MAG: 7-cyano-7-deazaguanine synthase QueC [bacterium]
MRDRAIALHSGGLDSSVAVALAMRSCDIALALTFDYGQRAAAREKEAAAAFCRERDIEHRSIALPWLAELGKSPLTHKDAKLPVVEPKNLESSGHERAQAVWIPNRNGLFVAIAASFAEGMEAKHVIAGFNREEAETFPDNGVPFMEATEGALSFSTLNKVGILCPTKNMDKKAIAREFIALKLGPDSFWCCYEGREKLCGRCESCARTMRAFKANDAFDAIRERFEQGTR